MDEFRLRYDPQFGDYVACGESEHHKYCPMSCKEYSTLCLCDRLNKAHRDAMKEDCEKWGEQWNK